MAAYNYKYVRDRLPPYLTDEVEGYEGSCDYDGDMWCSAADYIDALEHEIAKQYAATKTISDEKLFTWMKTRQKTFYNDGAAIIDA